MANLFRPTNAEKAAAIEIYRQSGSVAAAQRTGWTKKSILAWVRESDAGVDFDDVEPADWSWRENAACRGLPHEWWFPDTVGARAKRARAICASCPVQVECLEYALEPGNTAEVGIWAGTNGRQRRELRRSRVA